MAACSELEEKASSSKDALPLKIFLEESAGPCHSKLSNKLCEGSKTGDLANLSDDEFLHLLKEASTFHKRNYEESVLLKQLRKEAIKEKNYELSENKHSETLLSDASSSSSHITSDSKKQQLKNQNDTKNSLNSHKNVQQSLSLQDLFITDSKSKKSHKAQRTLSLSSEETATIISDSVNVTAKPVRKSNKQSYHSKGDLNKSSLIKCGSKTSVSVDSGHKRKCDTFGQNSNLSYATLINEYDIPLPDDPQPEDNDKSSGSPVEIEMEEIKSGKVSTKEDRVIASRSVEMNKNCVQQSNSKFYLDPNEVDAPVNFPLQLVSSITDENGVTVWPQAYQQVSHFLSNMPVNSDSLSQGSKQLSNSDINGNPFSRPSRPLSSFVPTSLLDYNNSTVVTENCKNRKNKRLRNAVNKGVLSENIAGHRGEEDIDALLQYINSSDQKGKHVKGHSPRGMLHENDKKKVFGKDIKNCHKIQKKLSRSNSMENLVSSTIHRETGDALSYESSAILDKPLKLKPKTFLRTSNGKTLDINSNVETHFSYTPPKNKDSSRTDNSVGLSLDQSSLKVSSFAADFYLTTDNSSQTVEESGFSVVKKKQRKKAPGKRLDSFRRRTNQAQRKKGMMIPLAESKCGKQDSRRKSTSSVPHSEHSSADNSDLDSVHSLPVRGSVPHPTQPHPHTTPSSSSSTPQASYADIARMPISKLNSPSPCIIAQASAAKQQVDKEFRKLDSSTNSFSCAKRQDMQECVANKTTASTLMIDESGYSEVKIRSYAKSTREINTQTEPETTNNETESIKAKRGEESPKAICSVCSSSLKKNCFCSKSQTVFRQKMNIPPVIMDNMPVETNPCNVSFGFGVEEVLQMTPTKQSELKMRVETPCSNFSKASVVNKTQSANDSSSSSSLTVPIKTVMNNSDLSSESSSHLRTVCYGNGKTIYYSETAINTKNFNLSEITNFLGMEFQSIEKELGVSSKVMYYLDSEEKA